MLASVHLFWQYLPPEKKYGAGVKAILLGHSAGGNVASRFNKQYEASAAVDSIQTLDTD